MPARRETPLTLFSQNPALGCTALAMRDGFSAHELFLTLKEEFDICVCPNGGALRDKVFRVGHMGNLYRGDYLELLTVLEDLKGRDLL